MSSEDTTDVEITDDETGIGEYIKELLILCKVTYIIVMMSLGIIAYYKKYRKVRYEILLFILYILEGTCLLIFEFGSKYIIMLFMMLAFSNYANFLCFALLI